MPSRRIHRLTSRLLLGRAFDQVHKLLDGPVKHLGRKHRLLYHDPLQAAVIGYACEGIEGTVAALIHTTIDKLYKEDKAIRNALDLLEAGQKRQRRKR